MAANVAGDDDKGQSQTADKGAEKGQMEECKSLVGGGEGSVSLLNNS